MNDDTLAPLEVTADGREPTGSPPDPGHTLTTLTIDPRSLAIDPPPSDTGSGSSDTGSQSSDIGSRSSDIGHLQAPAPRRLTYLTPHGVGFRTEAADVDPLAWAEAQCRANNLPFDPSLVLVDDEAGEPHTSSVDPS